MNGGPLSDVLVLDLSRVLTGPFAAMLLGDLGARVIKVERPGAGDETRQWGPPFVGSGSFRVSTYFLAVNRNKESIALDFALEEDKAVLLELIARADIVVENFRPGVLDRLGLGHGFMHQHNPGLIIVSITGFGHDGPASDRAGYDQIVQGEAGLMSVTGADTEDPTKVGLPIADLSAGMFGVIGALGALHERSVTGVGRVVHTSLLSSIVGLHTFQGTRWLLGGDLPEPIGNSHPTVRPYGAFRCRDGRQLQIAVGNDRLWQRFASVMDIAPMEPRFSSNEARRQHDDELAAILASRFLHRDLADWLECLEAAGVPVGEIKSFDRVYEDPQVLSQGLVIEISDPDLGLLRLPGSAIRLSEQSDRSHVRPPHLDEHGRSVREWLRVPPNAARHEPDGGDSAHQETVQTHAE